MVLLLYSLVVVPNMLLLNEITVVSAWSLILIGLTFRQFVHLEQFPFVDLLLFFRELLPFDRGESWYLWQAESGRFFHHLNSLIGQKKSKGSLRSLPLLLVAHYLAQTRISLVRSCHFLPYKILQLHPLLAFPDELLLHFLELTHRIVLPPLVIATKVGKDLDYLRYFISELCNLYKQRGTILRLSYIFVARKDVNRRVK